MIFKLQDIKEEGGPRIEVTRGTDWLGVVDEEGAETIKSISDMEFGFGLARVAGEITVRGGVNFSSVAICGRCLYEMEVRISAGFGLVLSPAGTEMPPEAQRKTWGLGQHHDYETQYDYEIYEGDTIDLNDYMREQIFLTLPYKSVCMEDCKGLCSGCGRDLNEEECVCGDSPEDTPFSSLKDVEI